jgi:hypothetical protein
MSPEQAADHILEAYADDDGLLELRDLRLAGPSVYSLERLIQAHGSNERLNREALLAFLESTVDHAPPAGVIDQAEALDWQRGPHAEERFTYGLDDAPEAAE